MEETKDFDIEPNADRLHKAKPLDSLPDCTEDCRMWLEMLRKDFSIPPSNIAVFASKENYYQIVGSKLWDENSYDFEKKRNFPRLVPEESLAIVKLVYHFMSRKIDPNFLREAQQAMLPQHKELSQASFTSYLDLIKEDAK